MKFGVHKAAEHFPGDSVTYSLNQDVADAAKLEELGFDEIWFGEHHTGGYEIVPSPELMLAKAAALTSHIRLGTSVIPIPYHNPILVAERLAQLDHLSYGRVNCGFGVGAVPHDAKMVGAEINNEQAYEELDIIEMLLTTDEPVTYHGEHVDIENVSLHVGPYQDRIPIFFSGLFSSDKYELMGRRGWGAMSLFIPAQVDDDRSSLRTQGDALVAGAEAAGRDPQAARDTWRIIREVHVSDSKNAAMNEIRAGVAETYEKYLYFAGSYGQFKKHRDMPTEDLTFEWLVDNVPWIVGSPKDCIEQIHDLYDDVGGFGSLLMFDRSSWTTTALKHRSWELFARQVIPEFKPNQYKKRRMKAYDDLIGGGGLVSPNAETIS